MSESESSRGESEISLMELIEEACRSTVEAERDWSAALNAASFKETRAHLQNVWGSILHLVARHSERIHSGLLRTELRSIPVTFPTPPAELEDISVRPDAQAAWGQLQVAICYSCARLVDALTVLQVESAYRLEFAQGTATEARWWQAGAFSHLIRSAEALARLLEYEDELLRTFDFTGDYVPDAPSCRLIPVPSSSALISRVLSALRYGNHEAAAILELACVRAMYAELHSTELIDVPLPLFQALADVDELQELLPGIGLLEQICLALGTGDRCDVGALVIVTEVVGQTLANLVFPPVPSDNS